MFRIECFLDDKNVSKILWALEELGVYNVSVRPVKDNTGAHANGQDAGMQRRRSAARKADLVDAFLAYTKQRKLRVLAANDIRDFADHAGYSTTSYGHVSNVLRAAGVLAKMPGSDKTHLKNTRYRVTPSKIKRPKKKDAVAPIEKHQEV